MLDHLGQTTAGAGAKGGGGKAGEEEPGVEAPSGSDVEEDLEDNMRIKFSATAEAASRCGWQRPGLRGGGVIGGTGWEGENECVSNSMCANGLQQGQQ